MKRVLIVGCGDIARRAMPELLKRGFRVYALVRRAEACAVLRALGVTPLLADLDDRRSLARVAGVAQCILHFAPPGADGVGDPRTRRLLAALGCASSLPQRVIYISTTGVYGDRAGRWVDETTPCRADSARARRRVEAEHLLRDFGRRTRTGVSILRVPGIYALDRAPLARIARGDPLLEASGDVYTNHIHADDLARIAVLALFRGRPGRVYNAVDDSDMQMGAYYDLVADLAGLPRAPRRPAHEVQQQVSPMAWSFMRESRRVRNRRLHEELRYRFIHPTVREGLAGLAGGREADAAYNHS